ncbi:hypothetical protein ACET3Z_009121 [Daucus carota]
MEKDMLDYVMVPSGLAIMVGYHVWLVFQILKRPSRTVIGINAINRRFWVNAMMEDPSKGVLAVQTLRNNIMASTLLASTAIMLSSLMAMLMTNKNGTLGDRTTVFVLGDKSAFSYSVKLFCIMVCFLSAFLLNVQSIRYYSHASILINVPYKKLSATYNYSYDQRLGSEYVAKTINRGSYFWSLGLRAFYFSFPLFLWIFGPIPMFLSCIVLVSLLRFLDVTLDFTSGADDHNQDRHVGEPEEP